MRAVQEVGRAHGQDGFRHDLLGAQALIDAFAVAQGEVDVGGVEVGHGDVGRDPDFGLGVLLLELLEPRGQPFGGEGGRRGDHQAVAAGGRAHVVDGFGHHFEGVGEERQGGLAGVGEQDGAAGAAEKGGAGELFELADLLGNGARGDVQFLGRAGEGQVAGGGLEGAQGVQGGEAVFLGHFT